LARTTAAALGGVAAVAITGIMRTQVLVDRIGRVVRPVLVWDDTRAAATLETLLATCAGSHPERAGLNAYHPLARLWWLKQNEPGALDATAHVLEPKDFLAQRLTGTVAGGTVSYVRLAAAARPAHAWPLRSPSAGRPDRPPRRYAPAVCRSPRRTAPSNSDSKAPAPCTEPGRPR
jgi:xylulokinase